MPGEPLTLLEREEIAFALFEDREASWAEIGRRVCRHPTTVAREVTGRGGRSGYRPAVAQHAAVRARRRPRLSILAVPSGIRDRVAGELKQGRSPVAIWADLVAENQPRVCVETIYTAVYDGRLGVKPAECLRTRRRRRRHRQERCANKRPGLPNISVRPAAVNDRSEAGHWEADHIIGANNASAMLWLTERQTRYAIGVTMPCGYSADHALAGLVEACEQIPTHLLKSVTFDQGSEWARWQTLAATYQIDAWFCDPHSPWQRGQIENQNRAWRWWFPRGTNLAVHTPAEVDHAAGIINNQRRRNLNYQTPANLYAALTVQ